MIRNVVRGLVILVLVTAVSLGLTLRYAGGPFLVARVTDGLALLGVTATITPPEVVTLPLRIESATARYDGGSLEVTGINIDLVDWRLQVSIDSARYQLADTAPPSTLRDLLDTALSLTDLPVDGDIGIEALEICFPDCEPLMLFVHKEGQLVTGGVSHDAGDALFSLSPGLADLVGLASEGEAHIRLHDPTATELVVTATGGARIPVERDLEAITITTGNPQVVAHLRLPTETVADLASIANVVEASAVITGTYSASMIVDGVELLGRSSEATEIRYANDVLNLTFGQVAAYASSPVARGTAVINPGSTCTLERLNLPVECGIAGVALDGVAAGHTFAADLAATDLAVTGADVLVSTSANYQANHESVGELTGDLAINVAGREANVSMTNTWLGDINLDAASLEWHMDENQGRFDAASLVLAADLAPLLAVPELAVGDGFVELEVRGTFTSAGEIGDLSATISLDDLAFSYDGYDVLGLSTAFQLEGYPVMSIGAYTPLTLDLIDIGLPVRDLATQYRASIDVITGEASADILSLEASLLDGQVTAADASFTYAETVDGNITFNFTDLALNELLALGRDDFDSSGRLSGSVPVQVKESTLNITGGRLDAVAPGGYIRYTPEDAVLASLANNEQVSLVIDTMSDFQYDSLGAAIDYLPSGDMVSQTAIRGNNPAMENGREIHLNIRLEENVGTLLRSLRISEVFTDRIEARTKQQ